MYNKCNVIHAASYDLNVYVEFPQKILQIFKRKISHQKVFFAKSLTYNYETNIFRSKEVTNKYQITFLVIVPEVEQRGFEYVLHLLSRK